MKSVIISCIIIGLSFSRFSQAEKTAGNKIRSAYKPELSESNTRYAFSDKLVVILMGDPQLPMKEDSPANVKKAMDDIITLEHDFMAVLGDLIQPAGSHDNKVTRYNMFRDLVLKPAVKPVFSISGNADCGVGLQFYQEYTGLPNHYTIMRRGIRFIFLGTTELSGHGRHICHVGKEGMDFLEKTLDEDKESTTVLFHHAPVQDTTYMSGKGARNSTREVHKPRDMFLGESDRMHELFKTHDNIKLFACGHTHIKYGATDTDDRGLYHEKDGVLHVAVGASANDRGSSVLFIDNKGIKVRVRSHDKKAWVEKFDKTATFSSSFKN